MRDFYFVLLWVVKVAISLISYVMVLGFGTLWVTGIVLGRLVILVSSMAVRIKHHEYAETYTKAHSKDIRDKAHHLLVWVVGYAPCTLVVIICAALQAVLDGLESPRSFKDKFSSSFRALTYSAYSRLFGWQGNKSSYTWGNYIMGMPVPSAYR